ncbi:glutamine--fructose-6-phosphate transaminase (isomerizing) [Rhodobacter sphaeroides]|jgi:glucosamine--fructose-6-phosphate aminotransferase (isomerizing)|uniref:Glutamine--fructose-6-phosphate aminotransferase [isomerizing] n=1 Tax=Cereibacter sphaeroides (strain ATCC 17023 / DSM 158 / JCM 6121 / CCUG 31486 / LMG 2827 / NBRC 12203 / NCIMB 8253 / ATH 2.4.1.) TaxID=272943 RepID=Q3J3H1_CERS4|nr:glutamine--fructose-6-phosphate transaminase (isomerizing) [Cereibacter sphaeroides]ABA78663.1 glutamine--fructose-6-phosphate transaminase [Cereibacter sphaeroides 2.4.1]AMJ47003.1 glucosamine--fructose-6-phosphate aminotransferase [Cereibacter sphaeroides]ANS33717.1 glutamine--fructose-6-phosphate aminotransferase [Cereibacter sphaeroides]ATN62760.1 glutamine--fructose-6-phosphate aminotransferase [Cereibacter sphaeroides]AXC60876.1 glutamine--fructose-6-phosphate transaminase (isomerizin
MCGIVGVLGNHEVAPLLVEALKRLEYRGYDSAGIATVNGGRLDRRRAVGKLVNLSDLLVHDPLAGKSGIGHTRWATHGAATVTNAHPHRAGPVAVVHNGIIENFRDLRAELAEAGFAFETQTDTETVALLTQMHMARGLGPREAAAETLARLTGAFALCFLFEGEDDLLIAARRGSPLAIGHGDGEMFVGSDAIALAPMTDAITYLEEGDWAVVTRAGAEIFDSHGRRVNRATTRIQIDAARIEKAGYKHFMAKEIAEQPVVLADALRHYVQDGRINLPGVDFTGVDRVTLVACGTASYACHVAKYWFEQIAGLPADVDIASEFRYREPVLSPTSWAVFVSQSGETADTLAALRHAGDAVARTLAVVNVPTSSIAREANLALPILAGIEVGVASTKAFTCQLTVLALLALKAAQDRGRIDAAELGRRLDALATLPGLMNHALRLADDIRDLAGELAEAQDILFLGRGPMYPLALEGALKLKEISYIHAEGYASGELKHGPIALIDNRVPVIVMAPRDALFDKTVSNMQEVMARHGKVLLISDARGIEEAGAGCWRTLALPQVADFLAPILYAVPAQLLAYHTAIAKGTDVDQPRNLAKSVTVE